MRYSLVLTLLAFSTLSASGSIHAAVSTDTVSQDTWWTMDTSGVYQVHLYFFWTSTCPHCKQAIPDVEDIANEFPWIILESRELTESKENGRLYAHLAAAVGARPQSVPAFLFCGQLLTGYDNRAGMGTELRQRLTRCRSTLISGKSPLTSVDTTPGDTLTQIPGLGQVDLSTWSLPAVALTLGLLDSFNPCAFFVLLFLLSLLVNAKSRARMLLIGGLFVAISGAVYFLFMAAWLNLFLVIGQLYWITLTAGVLALLIGGLNVKDFFYSHGPSLAVPQSAKPGLFRRMRALVNADSLASMITGTLVLAVFANAYEILCTAGFPMVFTRILTLQKLTSSGYYAYIGLYCAVYVVPLLTIVAIFVFSLGRRKLTEHEGRTLKLMSGLMMSGLGGLLVIRPDLLNNIVTTLTLLAVVLATTFILHRLTRTP